MTLGPRARVAAFGLVPFMLAAVLSVYRPRVFARAEYLVYDALVGVARTPPSGRVVIVDVDERSLSAHGQWPWRRDVIAELITRLRGHGASTIALDMIFAEADRSVSTAGSTDAALADALRAGHAAVGYAMTFGDARGASACAERPLPLTVIRNDDATDDPFFRATGRICNLPVLAGASNASGFLNAAPDPDGLLRRVPVLIELHGRVYPSLALAAVADMTGSRNLALRAADVNTSSLLLGAGSVTLDGRSNVLVRYRGPKHTFAYVSAADVLSGNVPAGALRDKLVFVGTTALGTREVVATPLDTLFTGVEVQATVADNLIQHDAIYRPQHAGAIEALAVLGLGLVGCVFVGRFGVRGAIGVVACVGIVWTAAIWLMSTRGVFLSPLFPTLGLSGSFASMIAAGFVIERRRANQESRDKHASRRLMVNTLLSLTEVKDSETGRHSRRTEPYTRVISEQLATDPRYRDYLTPQRIALMASLAPLHDIGKVGVPDGVLHKPGTLTSEELTEMRKHPAYGRNVIAKAEELSGVHGDVALEIAKDIIYTHHEKWDGTGYPQGLRGERIPIAGRVMAIVDVYDAILTRRLYANPMSHDEAVAFIAARRGTHFDPAVVDAFLQVSPVIARISAQQDVNDPAIDGDPRSGSAHVITERESVAS